MPQIDINDYSIANYEANPLLVLLRIDGDAIEHVVIITHFEDMCPKLVGTLLGYDDLRLWLFLEPIC